MLKNKKRFMVLFAILILANSLLTGFSNKIDVPIEDAHVAEDVLNGILPRANCLNCGVVADIPRCVQNYWLKTTYNHYFDRQCTVQVYQSNSAESCAYCGRYAAYYGPHPCLEIHSDCQAGVGGRVDICPIAPPL